MTNLTHHTTPSDSLEELSLTNLVSGLSQYLSRFGLILKTRSKFPEHLTKQCENDLKSAFGFAFYSIIITIILLIPSHMAHNQEIDKWPIITRFIVTSFLFGCMLHYTCKIFDQQKRKLRNGLVLYFHLGGFGLPLFIFFSLPLSISIGPIIIFGGFDDIDFIARELSRNNFLEIYNAVLSILFGLLGIFLFFTWYSRFYGIAKWKLIIPFFLVGIITNILALFVINPTFEALGPMINEIGEVIL